MIDRILGREKHWMTYSFKHAPGPFNHAPGWTGLPHHASLRCNYTVYMFYSIHVGVHILKVNKMSQSQHNNKSD